MSEENVEIVRQGYEAYNRGDLKGFAELLAADATMQPGPDWPDSLVRQGREEILGLLADIREPLERNEAAAEELVEGGDYVVAAHLWRGVVKGTDDEVEGRAGMRVALRAGKITELRFFNTFADALEAAGLRE